jgi:hypothetical protein
MVQVKFAGKSGILEFLEISLVIPFVVTDLTLLHFANLRLPWKKSGCLLALQVTLDYSPMMAHIL